MLNMIPYPVVVIHQCCMNLCFNVRLFYEINILHTNFSHAILNKTSREDEYKIYICILIYSPSHIAQITYFLDFLQEYCEEKSETFTEF